MTPDIKTEAGHKKAPDIFGRDQTGYCCPECNGFCEEVEPTHAETKKYGCGRSFACCNKTFVCKLCGTRWAGSAHAPEME